MKPRCYGPAAGRCLVDETRLAEYLSTQTGQAVAVHGSRRIGSGYSRVTHAVESTAGRFIVRVEQGRDHRQRAVVMLDHTRQKQMVKLFAL